MHVLESTIRVLKSKLTKYLRKYPSEISGSQFGRILQDAVFSYNHTVTKQGFTPSSVNSILFDPFLRQTIFPNEKLKPFDDFYSEQLKLQKRVNSPNPKADRDMDESETAYRVNDLVFLDFQYKNEFRKAYRIRRGNLYRIARVDTTKRPFLFTLKDLQNKEILGKFYAAELARANLDSLEVEKVIRRKRGPDGKKLAFVSFRGYDS